MSRSQRADVARVRARRRAPRRSRSSRTPRRTARPRRPGPTRAAAAMPAPPGPHASSSTRSPGCGRERSSIAAVTPAAARVDVVGVLAPRGRDRRPHAAQASTQRGAISSSWSAPSGRSTMLPASMIHLLEQFAPIRLSVRVLKLVALYSNDRTCQPEALLRLAAPARAGGRDAPRHPRGGPAPVRGAGLLGDDDGGDREARPASSPRPSTPPSRPRAACCARSGTCCCAATMRTCR